MDVTLNMKITYRKFLSILLSSVLLSGLFIIPSFATETDTQVINEHRQNIPIESNQIPNWPVGPTTSAQSAILMEADTGIILYSKNIHEKLYPASITKILTAIVAYENCEMNETVTFSYDAVSSIDWRTDANMGINAGDSITMEQALYGMLVGSANEAAYAIAEHVAGNIDAFSNLMNEKAAALGCTDSHFVTPNGIHDENHYTSSHDMALIAQAFFSNNYLATISNTPSHKIPSGPNQPNDNMIVYAKSKLFPGKEYAYEYLRGTKTGYTQEAGQTLVSCAEKDGMKLICVVMKEEAPLQYIDTIELFNYGFSNFTTYNVSDKDSKHTIATSDIFNTNHDIFGNSEPIMEINPNNSIILPLGIEPDQTESEIIYEDLKNNEIARINYYYYDTYVGSASIIPCYKSEKTDISEGEIENSTTTEDNHTFFINIYYAIGIILIIVVFLTIIFMLISFIHNGKRYKRKSNTNKSYNYKNKKLNWKHFK